MFLEVKPSISAEQTFGSTGFEGTKLWHVIFKFVIIESGMAFIYHPTDSCRVCQPANGVNG